MRVILFLAALLLLPGAALAEGSDSRAYVRKALWSSCEFWGTCYRYRYHNYDDRWERVRVVYRRAPTHHHHERPYREANLHYRTPDRDDRHDDPRGQCLGTTLDVLSTEHQSEENARESARKLIMAKIQWLHGSQFMDLGNAADMRWRCSASNAHDTVSGRLSEATAKLTGREGQNVRCALWVRPCKAAREKERDARR